MTVLYSLWLFGLCFVFCGYGDHRDLHVLAHSFPTRRSSDLGSLDAGHRGAPLLREQKETAIGRVDVIPAPLTGGDVGRSEEHTSELQSLMRISYAVFCLKNKTAQNTCERQHRLEFTYAL